MTFCHSGNGFSKQEVRENLQQGQWEQYNSDLDLDLLYSPYNLSVFMLEVFPLNLPVKFSKQKSSDLTQCILLVVFSGMQWVYEGYEKNLNFLI